MVNSPTINTAPSQIGQPSCHRKPRLRTIGASVSPQVYAEMQAIAAAEHRTLAYLGGLAILEFLIQRKATSIKVLASSIEGES